MKITIFEETFNDKMFWAFHDNKTALDYFIPHNLHWRQKGIQFELRDHLEIHRYLRHIVITAEGDEKVLNLMVLKGFNK